MKNLEKHLNAVVVLILSSVLFGAFGIQIFYHENPCPLCLLQRLGMLGVGIGALMNLRYGIHRRHYAVCLLSAFFGGFVALRQIMLHVCPGFPRFGLPFWGLSLYTWSFIVFLCSVLFVAFMMLIFKQPSPEHAHKVQGWHRAPFAFLFVAAFANIFVTYALCGFGPCVSP